MNTDNLVYFYLTLGVMMFVLLFGIFVSNKVKPRIKSKK